jgi:hypothetical protein
MTQLADELSEPAPLPWVELCEVMLREPGELRR